MPPGQKDMLSHEGDGIVDEGTERCHLLEIAPELRNRIYDYALIRTPSLTINAALRPPALLHTCRQVRDEATKLWLYHSQFVAPIHDYDAKFLMGFCKVYHDAIQALPGESGLLLAYRMSGKPHWANLLKWCKSVYDGASGYDDHAAHDSPKVTILVSALRIAGTSAITMEWEQCQIALEELRKVAGLVDSDWLKDWDTVDEGVDDSDD